MLNLTITGPTNNSGFVAVFPANIAWPFNSSINWFVANETVANGVITTMDALGQIKIRAGGGGATDVILDRSAG